MTLLKNQKFFFIVTDFRDERYIDLCDSREEANSKAFYEEECFSNGSSPDHHTFVAYTMLNNSYYDIPRFNPFFNFCDLDLAKFKKLSQNKTDYDSHKHIKYYHYAPYDFMVYDKNTMFEPLGETVLSGYIEKAKKQGSYQETINDLRAYLIREIGENIPGHTYAEIIKITNNIILKVYDLIENNYENQLGGKTETT